MVDVLQNVIAGPQGLIDHAMVGQFVGCTANSVAQRTPEVGIRITLGAQPRAVTGMFIRHRLLLSGLGIAWV